MKKSSWGAWFLDKISNSKDTEKEPKEEKKE